MTTEKTKLNALSVLCRFLQIAGLALIVFQNQLPAFTPVLIGIAGFAAIVMYFIPGAKGVDKTLRPIAAFAGFGIVLFACVTT
jgi:hypothetical protein